MKKSEVKIVKSDRKKGKPFGLQTKTTEYEVCKRCGTLHEWGTKCPNCKLSYEEDEGRFDKWTLSEGK